MSHEYFYHYTTIEAAKDIFLSDMIKPSLAANGARHGDGVYLTTVDPHLGRQTVLNNNWAGIVQVPIQKLERYFEIRIPSYKVRRAIDQRDIQIYTGDVLMLADYSWSLRSWEGDLMATQFFKVSSQGRAARENWDRMGRY